MASRRFGTLYTGSARDLLKRAYEHREGLLPGFTRKYGVTRLVWFEPHGSVSSAYAREKLIKRWRRAWKISLIEERNPHWDDLYPALGQFGALPGTRPLLTLPGRDEVAIRGPDSSDAMEGGSS
ncbi:MAG: GIY-YIG nuclease family protein [Hyphomonadaceae bacterium]|nr:GIY-YIG nuclease family protein [Hyphomonadaceae bacterium]